MLPSSCMTKLCHSRLPAKQICKQGSLGNNTCKNNILSKSSASKINALNITGFFVVSLGWLGFFGFCV